MEGTFLFHLPPRQEDAMECAERILDQMSGVSKPQRKFLMVLFSTILLMRGKVNFRNLSRYSILCEKTFSRQFRKSFDFVTFNRLLLDEAMGSDHEKIAAIDCSYLPKSGKKTYGIDTFFDSTHNKPAKGLEISTLCVVDVTDHTAYALSSRQTPPLEEIRSRSPIPSSKKGVSKTEAQETRMDAYLDHVHAVRSRFPTAIRYLVGDGEFAKYKFVEGVVGCDLDFIGKLRCDANLRYLYDGPQKPRGAHRKYDGKVKFDEVRRLEYVGQVENKIHLYTTVVNSISLKRNVRIAYLLNLRDEKHPRYVLLFSTDSTLCATKIYLYYKARFQLEFIFRDAKQFTGLCDCQARCRESLHFHVNASLTTVNLAKIEAQRLLGTQGSDPFSMASVKTLYFNEHLVSRVISMLDLDQTSIINHPQYQNLRAYGAIAA
jgi:hypothetical protein